jgi:hypothetical protein
MTDVANTHKQSTVTPEWESPADCAMVLGISRASVYHLIGLGLLDARKLLGRTIINVASRRAYLANLPKAQIAPPKKAVAS